jgi:hypothetical protein
VNDELHCWHFCWRHHLRNHVTNPYLISEVDESDQRQVLVSFHLRIIDYILRKYYCRRSVHLVSGTRRCAEVTVN